MRTSSIHYPFGMLMPERTFSSPEYRYGFQGYENIIEEKGSGNSIDFGARIFDPRLGKFLSVDPRETEFPYMSTYCFAGNNPIAFEDLNGEGPLLRIFNRIFGRKTKTLTVEEYKEKFKVDKGTDMTPAQQADLARGCIGITVVNLGENGLPNPPINNAYSTFRQAKRNFRKLKKDIKNNPTKYPIGAKAEMFSKRFYTSDDKKFLPDKYGKVDMTGYDYSAKPGFVNFDYGYYDQKTGYWWHANHSEPGMKVYRSKLKHYSRPLLDFNRQIFVVTFSNL